MARRFYEVNFVCPKTEGIIISTGKYFMNELKMCTLVFLSVKCMKMFACKQLFLQSIPIEVQYTCPGYM